MHLMKAFETPQWFWKIICFGGYCLNGPVQQCVLHIIIMEQAIYLWLIIQLNSLIFLSY